ncbi:major histocompatibility complex class I-related gene protein-like [Xyrichtys novacula]|uniref:Major histocompatibility complex class I-related gene protein-like n=1 Tax=Xyrichtys novacula TaxID=13765 RepID=A0AAV1HBR2_XYRNO|nr:major histocompatibility complex class I-related gene protein-like [Xyrichtys novacula]
MRKFFLFLLFCHVSSPVKHSLKFFFTGSSGIPDLPDFVGAAEVDQIQTAYCDSNKKLKPRQDWVKKIVRYDRQQLNWYKEECFVIQPNFLKATINYLMERLGQSEGVHVLQRISGCEWDDETGETDGFMRFGYDGEDFLTFDVKSLTWIALTPKAVSTKFSWDTDKSRIKHYENYLTQVCPEWLKKYVEIGKNSLRRKDLPSVSLLQKSPSSPVTCHASGFHPNKALMFWRKDGEELHEEVDLGETLLNHDGSFQMSADLNITSVEPEDWGRYECVFQLHGVKENIITKLDRAAIRTNLGKSLSLEANNEGPKRVSVVGAVVGVFILVLVCAVFGFIHNKKKTRRLSPGTTQRSSAPDPHQEEGERLNP